MRFIYYLFAILVLLSCEKEQETKTLLVFNNSTEDVMKVVFFANEEQGAIEFQYSDSYTNALEDDTIRMDPGQEQYLIWTNNHLKPTEVISDVLDGIKVIQISSDSVFKDGAFIGFKTNSIKYEKSIGSDVETNVFTDEDSWYQKEIKNSWSANFSSQEERVHMYIFDFPDLLIEEPVD